MAQAILKSNGIVVLRWICRPLTTPEMESLTEKALCDEFNAKIKSKHGDSLTITEVEETIPNFDEKDFLVDDDKEVKSQDIPEEDPINNAGKAVLENPTTDILIHTEVLLP